jgi:uncharacterized metal-binding protein YceD (DUF177 family)
MPELDWKHAIEEIPSAGLACERSATPEELARLVRALELEACLSLKTAYRIAPTGGGRYALSGCLEAQVEQACVVSLDPVVSAIREPFDYLFVSERDLPSMASGELDLDDEPETAAIENGCINVGQVVQALLAEAIDPFPRSPGAVLEQQTAAPPDAGGEPSNPFAVLAALKRKARP